MKKTIIISFLLLLIGSSISAQKITYVYDNAGNRLESKHTIEIRNISRETKSIIAQTNQASNTLEKQELGKSVSINFIKVYPNPTYGRLWVEIPGFKPELKGCIEIYNTASKLIYKTKKLEMLNKLNILNQPQGIYFMKVQYAHKTEVVKIIKK